MKVNEVEPVSVSEHCKLRVECEDRERARRKYPHIDPGTHHHFGSYNYVLPR